MLGQKSPPKTALDDLTFSDPGKSGKHTVPNSNEGDYASSGEDIEDLVFRTAIQPGRTGDFDLDFPKSPKVSKGKGKKGKHSMVPLSPVNPNTTNDNNVTSIELAGKKNLTEQPTVEEPVVVASKSKDIGVNTSLQDDTATQPIVLIKATGRPRIQSKEHVIDTSDEDLDHMGNIRPSGIITVGGYAAGTIKWMWLNTHMVKWNSTILL